MTPCQGRTLHTASFYLLNINSEKDTGGKGGDSALKEKRKKYPKIFCSFM